MKPLLLAHEAAVMLRITPNRLYKLAKRGIIPSIRVGRQVRFSEAALIAWMEAGGQGLEDTDKASSAISPNLVGTSTRG